MGDFIDEAISAAGVSMAVTERGPDRYDCTLSSDDILDWAKYEDRDPGAADARAEFQQLVDDERELRILLGEENFQNLMAALSISQAINNARPRP